jgi:hypothetical protein
VKHKIPDVANTKKYILKKYSARKRNGFMYHAEISWENVRIFSSHKTPKVSSPVLQPSDYQ